MGLGCMTMSWPGRDEQESLGTLSTALDAGVTLLDTADRYGDGHNERLLSRVLRTRRGEVVLATKVGFGRSPDGRRVDGRPEHLHAAARASLQRLGVEHVDLLYLHRVDPQVPVQESVGALAELVEQGLAHRIGLSEVGPQTLRAAAAVHRISALQSEYSLWSRDVEADVLPACRELGVTFVAYGPLGKGFLAGALRSAADVEPELARQPRLQPGTLEQNLHLVDGLSRVADRIGCTPAALALSWLIAHGVVPIPSSARRAHLFDNLGALDVRLSTDDLAELERVVPPGAAVGARKPPSGTELTAP
jgi:aryl-alcohol dehydrogenase-like predicted oxidoreductase